MKLLAWIQEFLFGGRQFPLLRRKLARLLDYPNVWETHSALIVRMLHARSGHLTMAFATPPALFLPTDDRFSDVHDEVRRLIRESVTHTLDLAQVEGFVERIYSGLIIVLKESLWREFVRGTPWAVGTVAHEFGHVEEQYRFGQHLEEGFRDANLRKVWAEFFAEQIAGPLYDQNQLTRYLRGLNDIIRNQAAFEIPNHLGRITGHASSRGRTSHEIAGILAAYGQNYSNAGRELTEIFTAATHDRRLPNWDRVYEVLTNTIM